MQKKMGIICEGGLSAAITISSENEDRFLSDKLIAKLLKNEI